MNVNLENSIKTCRNYDFCINDEVMEISLVIWSIQAKIQGNFKVHFLPETKQNQAPQNNKLFSHIALLCTNSSYQVYPRTLSYFVGSHNSME
jgi:hypothetical protein